jgi:hypothetical protein
LSGPHVRTVELRSAKSCTLDLFLHELACVFLINKMNKVEVFT